MDITIREQLAWFPVFMIAFLSWGYNLLILDRFRGFRNFKKIEIYALFVSLTGGVGAWIAEMSVKNENLIGLQITSSVFRALTSWLVLVIVVNEDVFLTRQQLWSLGFRITITVLWEIQHRLVLGE